MTRDVILSHEVFQRLIAHLQTALQLLSDGEKDDEFVKRADELVTTALLEVRNAS